MTTQTETCDYCDAPVWGYQNGGRSKTCEHHVTRPFEETKQKITRPQAKRLYSQTMEASGVLEATAHAFAHDLVALRSGGEGEPVPTKKDFLRLVKTMQEALREIQEAVEELQ